MTRPIPLRYDGKDFPSRAALAKHLAEITGCSWQRCRELLVQFDNNPTRVIAYADKAHRKYRKQLSIIFENRIYQQQELAARLAEIIDHPWQTCSRWLRQFDNNPTRVIAYAATTNHRRQVSVTLAGQTFPSRGAFARYLHQHYGPGVSAVEQWLSRRHLSPEQCLERARAYRKKHRKPPQHTGEVVLFGWHFSSPKALCTYYGIPYARFLTEWRARQSGTPVDRIPAVMRTIAQLWEIGRLDERNRQPQQIEARLPKASLPTNALLDEKALTAYERAVLDCLQPADARTPRRDGLAWLARMRQRAAS